MILEHTRSIDAMWLRQDGQSHTTWSDGSASIAEMVEQALRRGLRWYAITDHVWASSPWIAEYAKECEDWRARAFTQGLELWCGVEAKLLSPQGALDCPEVLPSTVRMIAIADHQWPMAGGVMSPRRMREHLDSFTDGPLRRSETLRILADYCGALCGAMTVVRGRGLQPYIAHPFSLLEKTGLCERDIPPVWMASLASTAVATGTLVEISEKWHTPTEMTIRSWLGQGVTLVPGSDAHSPDRLGEFSWVAQVVHRLRQEATPE